MKSRPLPIFNWHPIAFTDSCQCFFEIFPPFFLIEAELCFGYDGRQEIQARTELRDHSATKLALILSLLAKLADFDSLHKSFNIMQVCKHQGIASVGKICLTR